MQKLSDKEIIRLMRVEWNRKLIKLAESVDVSFDAKVDGEEKPVIDVGLKLRNKVKKTISSEAQPGDKGGKIKSKNSNNKNQTSTRGYLYTVVAVSPRGVILQTPEGKQFSVDKETLEQEYELD